MANKKTPTTTFIAVLPAIIAAIAGIVGSFFSYRAGVDAIQIPLNATRAAESTLVMAILSATPSQVATSTIMPTSTPSSPTCADYGIKITSPQSGAKAWGAFMVKGNYVNDPPVGGVLLLLKAPAGDYFPQKEVIIDYAQRAWQGEISLGDGSGKDYVIIVSIMGNNGRALFDYFTKVGTETGRWPAIVKLTDDIVECDRVSIVHEQ
jgi:hypothetical protein